MINLVKNKPTEKEITVTKRFYKENGIWYIDLPEFLEAGLGTKANLMMVSGADTLLDILSKNTDEVTVKFSNQKFEGYNERLSIKNFGLDKDYLDEIGHAPVDYGAYYKTTYNTGFDVWLCPVTMYVCEGGYPEYIYIKTIK